MRVHGQIIDENYINSLNEEQLTYLYYTFVPMLGRVLGRDGNVFYEQFQPLQDVVRKDISGRVIDEPYYVEGKYSGRIIHKYYPDKNFDFYDIYLNLNNIVIDDIYTIKYNTGIIKTIFGKYLYTTIRNFLSDSENLLKGPVDKIEVNSCYFYKQFDKKGRVVDEKRDKYYWDYNYDDKGEVSVLSVSKWVTNKGTTGSISRLVPWKTTEYPDTVEGFNCSCLYDDNGKPLSFRYDMNQEEPDIEWRYDENGRVKEVLFDESKYPYVSSYVFYYSGDELVSVVSKSKNSQYSKTIYHPAIGLLEHPYALSQFIAIDFGFKPLTEE